MTEELVGGVVVLMSQGDGQRGTAEVSDFMSTARRGSGMPAGENGKSTNMHSCCDPEQIIHDSGMCCKMEYALIVERQTRFSANRTIPLDARYRISA